MADDKTTPEEGESDDFPQTYIKFRSTLDALEMTAMRYFLKDKDDAGRIERAEELERELMPIIKKYQNQMMREGNPGECPEGCFNCDGCCLPYPCP